MNGKAIFIVSALLFPFLSYSQETLQNPYSRQNISLDGKWQVIIDPFNAGAGNWKPVWKDQQPKGKNDFYEYAFTDKITLDVPGDWNHQKPELLYYESTVWYKKTFTVRPKANEK